MSAVCKILLSAASLTRGRVYCGTPKHCGAVWHCNCASAPRHATVEKGAPTIMISSASEDITRTLFRRGSGQPQCLVPDRNGVRHVENASQAGIPRYSPLVQRGLLIG